MVVLQAASPACTELETIVLDWLGKAIGLPDDFLAFKEGSRGGGVIQVEPFDRIFSQKYYNIFLLQTSASECVLVTMLAARAQAIKRLKQQHPFVEEGVLLSKLMAYCSKEAHSCVEKAAMIDPSTLQHLNIHTYRCVNNHTHTSLTCDNISYSTDTNSRDVSSS